jgi:hypothetical protein
MTMGGYPDSIGRPSSDLYRCAMDEARNARPAV